MCTWSEQLTAIMLVERLGGASFAAITYRPGSGTQEGAMAFIRIAHPVLSNDGHRQSPNHLMMSKATA